MYLFTELLTTTKDVLCLLQPLILHNMRCRMQLKQLLPLILHNITTMQWIVRNFSIFNYYFLFLFFTYFFTIINTIWGYTWTKCNVMHSVEVGQASKATLGCRLSRHVVFCGFLHAPPCSNDWGQFLTIGPQPLPSQSFLLNLFLLHPIISQRVVRLWWAPLLSWLPSVTDQRSSQIRGLSRTYSKY
jgi:hypothetical protein